ncbi:MAG: UDP-N-acetylenolpyruvoylglucosamine reductase, partial [Deltaproteobacteria bacterium]
MTPLQLENLKKIGNDRVHVGYPLGKMSTFKAGGSVEALCEVDSSAMLKEIVEFLVGESIPYTVIGRGSNILVRDEGLQGVVILLEGEFEKIVKEEGQRYQVIVGAGTSLFDLLLYCRDQGLRGLELLAGIPGKVGGATCMNAGGFGGRIADHISAVQMMDRDGTVRWVGKKELRFNYRSFSRPIGSVLLRILISLTPDSQEAVRQRIVEYLKAKKQRQPLDQPSAGCVFKNPPGDYAGRMIEEAGLKGKTIGGAKISEKHANFIVNTGGATARDVLCLIDLV